MICSGLSFSLIIVVDSILVLGFPPSLVTVFVVFSTFLKYFTDFFGAVASSSKTLEYNLSSSSDILYIR